MSDDQDQSQKTEEPTQKKLEDARKKGQVATSRELNNTLMISAATAFVALISPNLTYDLSHTLIPFLEIPHEMSTGVSDLQNLTSVLTKKLGMIMLLPALLFLGAALVSGLIQNGLVISTEPLKPKLEKVSIISGAKRIFSTKSIVEFVKGIFKIALIGAAAVLLLWPEAASIVQTTSVELVVTAVMLQDLTTKLLFGVAVLIVIISILDLLYQRFEHQKQLRMSRKDLMDEYKQTEGDPHVKARLKGLRAEKARQRMMAEVPNATVVVTNPTHFAVALFYDSNGKTAPRAVAKGVDSLAQRIRDVATEHQVPIVENPPLARALFASVELGEEIQPEHYKAVAEVIGYVMRLESR